MSMMLIPRIYNFYRVLAVLAVWASLWGLVGCDEAKPPLGDKVSLDDHLNTSPVRSDDIKGDDTKNQFPAERDLAILIPRFRAIYPVLEIISETWLQAVDDALLESEINQRLSEANRPEDWSLVAVRISPCNPLGHIADLEEIDRLCWPEVRLILQPIVQLIRPTGETFFFADDRSIHALYRIKPQEPALIKVLSQIKQGIQLNQLNPELLLEFETARDQAVVELLRSTKSLRVSDGVYYSIAERPEFNDSEQEEQFWDVLTESLIIPYCSPNALYHLTAMSLPLGRAPVPLDLWSFVAFDAAEGVLEQVDLLVRDRFTGEVLLNFQEDLGKTSEDVSAAVSDPQMLAWFRELDVETKTRLYEQTILDRRRVSQQALEIVDPYKTLVAHTTCSSCHRFNRTPFNFHNLSYFGDLEMSVSPRVEADVARELEWLTRFQLKNPLQD